MSGKTDTLSNYHPISILTSFSKVLKKLINKRLTIFFKNILYWFSLNTVFKTIRVCFQNNISKQNNTLLPTIHAIRDVLTTSYDQINDNNFTSVVLLNFQKAFDTVCDASLFRKLGHYGIRGVAQKLNSSFLCGRQHYSCPSRYAIRNSH